VLCTPWVAADVVAECCGVEEVEEVEDVTLAASQTLYDLTARQWPGVCTDTVRVFRGTRSLCTFTNGRKQSILELGVTPVREVFEVVVDGDVLDPTSYEVWNAQYVIRTDDEEWPMHSVIEASFEWGALPNANGVEAAKVLACELHKARCGDKACRLPARTQSVTRQGLQLAMDVFIDDNRTGIFVVDNFIESANPAGVMEAATVTDPMRYVTMRKTWETGS